LHQNNQNNSLYLRFKNPSHRSIDGVLVEHDMLVQCTTSHSHDVDHIGMQTALKCLDLAVEVSEIEDSQKEDDQKKDQSERYGLYVFVPDHVYPDFQWQRYKDRKHVVPPDSVHKRCSNVKQYAVCVDGEAVFPMHRAS
jgi:hypothetical protein